MAEYNRRLSIKGAAGVGKRGVELVRLASTDDNLFIETTCAAPNYQYVRSAVSSADTTIPTDAPLWDLSGFMGLSCYVEFNGSGSSESVTLQLWAHDDQNDNPFLVEEAGAVGALEEVYFANMVRNRRCYVVVSALTLGGYTNVNVYAAGV